MTLSRQDLIREILTHTWRAPILRVLSSGPKRYGKIRTDLFNLIGQYPGDGYVSTELKKLRELGLLRQGQIDGASRLAWQLTELGVTAFTIVQEFENLSNDAAVNETRRPGGLDLNEIEARALQIDTTTPHPARRYNYLLGGKDHFAVDRESAELLESVSKSARATAVANRGFLQRAVSLLADEAKIDQFLDIGTGLPTADNTHEVAQRLNPYSKVVYVDNDH